MVYSRRGMRSFHSMVKWGWTILWLAGRLSQIWNSSTGWTWVGVRAVGTFPSAWMPFTSRHPLHVAPAKAGGCAQRIGMVDEPLAHQRHRLKAPGAGGQEGKTGHGVAVVHAAVLAAEVAADLAAFRSGTAGAKAPSPAG